MMFADTGSSVSGLERRYQKLWEESLARFRAGDFEYDPRIGDPADRRYGLTLLARPDARIQSNVQTLLGQLRELAPDHYYYPSSDLHMTVLSIISCREGFSLDQLELPAYQQLIAQVVAELPPLGVRFQGLTASPSCVMIQGYPENHALAQLRDALRQTFRGSGLTHSMDKRYTLSTAHMTVIRFRKKAVAEQAFLERLVGLKDIDFGRCRIQNLELVGNDWYQRQRNTTPVASWRLAQVAGRAR